MFGSRGDLAHTYDFRDVDGRQPPAFELPAGYEDRPR